AGSGTTAHAVLELNKQDGGNRQFILCEQMDYIEDATKARIQKVIQNNATEINFNETNNQFIYAELAPLNQTFIDAIHKTDDSETLLKIRAKILQTHSIQYNFKSDDELKLQENYDSEQGFKQLTADEQKQILIKMLDKNQLYVNYSERTDEDFKSSDDVIAISENFYDKK
ncbi:MAG: site-specific DNA-methyltransferase, partial [Alphaproteobacteria bacterium]|nr:site-specific DNA-methyltransferase [Alphaproteobacteria bacterium]